MEYGFADEKDKHREKLREREDSVLPIRMAKGICALLVVVPFYFVWSFFYNRTLIVPFYRYGNWLITLLFGISYIYLAHLYSGFSIQISRISEIVYAQALSLGLADGLMLVITWLLAHRFPNPIPLFVTGLGQLGLIVVWSVTSHRWYERRYPPLRTVIIWDEISGMDTLIHRYQLEQKFRIIRSLHVKACEQEDLETVLKDAQAVFLCYLHSHERNQVIKCCVRKDISVYTVPRIGDMIMSGAEKKHLFHLPMLYVHRYNPLIEYRFIKRAMDILLSLAALVICSPLMIVVSLMIRGDGGTVLYRQKRLTKDGRVFEMLKFRSMRMDAEKDGRAVLSSGEADKRVTPVGRVIRALRVDELPQFVNILRGDISIVGPRPERPEIAAEYARALPEFDLRLQVRAGLTGYAQVYGKYNSSPYDKLLMDLMYIAHPSIVEDIKIILATFKILFIKESTEGVPEGQNTAVGGEGSLFQMRGDDGGTDRKHDVA